MKIDFKKLADALGMEIEQYHEYQYHRIMSLENELKRVKETLIDISEISTKEAINITVTLN